MGFWNLVWLNSKNFAYSINYPIFAVIGIEIEPKKERKKWLMVDTYLGLAKSFQFELNYIFTYYLNYNSIRSKSKKSK